MVQAHGASDKDGDSDVEVARGARGRESEHPDQQDVPGGCADDEVGRAGLRAGGGERAQHAQSQRIDWAVRPDAAHGR